MENRESLGVFCLFVFFFLRKEGAWGSTFIGFKGRGPRVSGACSLLVNLKHKTGNLKQENRKDKGPKWSVIKINQGL